MLRIDSIRLKTNIDVIKDIDLNYFNETIKTDLKNGKNIGNNKFAIKKDVKPVGLGNIIIDKETVIIDMSGKILKSDYYNLINKNTIFNALGNINSPAVSFDKYKLLESQVLKLDITNNIQVEKNIKKYIQMIYLFSKNSDKYNINKYKYSGLVFVKNNATKKLKDRLITYNKTIEIIKDKQMLELIKDIDKFKNVLRFESNLRTFQQIRKRLDLDKKIITLKDVLVVKAKVNYNFFNEILKTASAPIQFINKEKTPIQIIKEIGFNAIHKELGIKKAKEFIKVITGKNSDPYSIISQMKKAVNINLESNNNYINEIKDKLKAV
ncbi:MAG: hypothetical protein U9R42_08855 [Bacteroidota bacterium]|nr:hypothetical protein [Bacteroidota bacterium]